MRTNSYRHLMQVAVLVLTLAIGLQFYLFVAQTLQTGAPQVARPPGVEGFLPIGGLMAWKLFLQSPYYIANA